MTRLLEPHFCVKSLTFGYTDTLIFKDFSAETASKVVALRGPSGCGKTTLLKLLTGFLQPASYKQLPSAEYPALVIQEDGLFPWMTGSGNLRLSKEITLTKLEAHPLYTMVKELLPLRIHSMSYGQRRKIEVFGALLRNHDMLCLDEPLNFIDPASRRRLIEYINGDGVQAQLIVITSHYESDISGLNCHVVEFDGKFPVSDPLQYSYSGGLRLDNKHS